MAQIISCIGTKLGHNIQNISIMSNRNIKQMRDLCIHLFGHTVVSPQQSKRIICWESVYYPLLFYNDFIYLRNSYAHIL